MDGETNQGGDLWTFFFFFRDQFWLELMKLVNILLLCQKILANTCLKLIVACIKPCSESIGAIT